MEYQNDQPAEQGYDGQRDYTERDRSRSPRPEYRDNGDDRVRDSDMNGREERPPVAAPADDEEEARNPGSNLFVTGIHPRLTEDDITRLFEKYGNVEKANIMRDPHTRESRGFGFVNMSSGQEADAAKEGLQGEIYEGRTLSIEKARRSKPRTSTPGKYFGPPKRDDFRGGRGGRYDRYDDRRGGGGYGGGYGRDRRDDGPYSRGGGGGRDRYDDRSGGYGGGRRDRDDRYAPRGGGGGRDYGRRDYEGGGGSYGAGEAAGGSGRSYDDRPRGGDDYSRR